MASMNNGKLGKHYQDGEVVIQQGEEADCMYVIQSGHVEVVQNRGDKEVILAKLGTNDFFGEMSLFDKDVRSTTIRVLREARILTVDRRTLLSTITNDPSMAFRLLETLSLRIRKINNLLTRIQASDRRNWETRSEHHDS